MRSPDFLKQIDGRTSPKELAEEDPATPGDAAAERRACFSRFGLAFEAGCPASLLYHQHSSLNPEWECPLSEEEVSRLTLDLTYKRYPDAPQVALPEAPAVQASLEDAVRQRRTAGSFGDAPISLAELAKLLQLACGLTQHGRLPLRAAPSPGALYAIEAYPVAFDVTGLVPGVYHYLPIEQVVEFVRTLRGVEEIWPALPPGWRGEMPALAIVLVARLQRVQAKYGERGYRFVLLESGHIAQNLLLASAALDLAATGVGGFFDDAMNSLIEVDGEQEVALYTILIGRSEVNRHVNSMTKRSRRMPEHSNVDAVIGRALRDQEFRNRMLSDPHSVAHEYNLSADDLTTLENINQQAAAGGKKIMGCTDKTCYENG